MSLLGKNGTFILKVFTMFEKQSAYLMQIIYKAFEVVTVAKPATSKGGNSEVYVVARGYRGREHSSCLIEELEVLFPFENLKSRSLLLSMFFNLIISKSNKIKTFY